MIFLLKAVGWLDRKYTGAVAKQKLEQDLLKQQRSENRQKSTIRVRHRDIDKVKPPL